jgi:hypothetical protein
MNQHWFVPFMNHHWFVPFMNHHWCCLLMNNWIKGTWSDLMCTVWASLIEIFPFRQWWACQPGDLCPKTTDWTSVSGNTQPFRIPSLYLPI